MRRPFSEQLSEFRGIFSEQPSEWHSQPNVCDNPILRATLGATLRIRWMPKVQPKFSELSSKLGWSQRSRVFTALSYVLEDVCFPIVHMLPTDLYDLTF